MSSVSLTSEDFMMLDWNGYRKELSTRIGELAKLTPGTLHG
jgi:hypothetical protein